MTISTPFKNVPKKSTQLKSVKLSQQILSIQCLIINLSNFLLSLQGYLGSGAISVMLGSGTASLLMLDLFCDSNNFSVVISLLFFSFNVGVDKTGLLLGSYAGIVSSVVIGISVCRTSSFLLSIKFAGMYLDLICLQCLFQITSST